MAAPGKKYEIKSAEGCWIQRLQLFLQESLSHRWPGAGKDPGTGVTMCLPCSSFSSVDASAWLPLERPVSVWTKPACCRHLYRAEIRPRSLQRRRRDAPAGEVLLGSALLGPWEPAPVGQSSGWGCLGSITERGQAASPSGCSLPLSSGVHAAPRASVFTGCPALARCMPGAGHS